MGGSGCNIIDKYFFKYIILGVPKKEYFFITGSTVLISGGDLVNNHNGNRDISKISAEAVISTDTNSSFVHQSSTDSNTMQNNNFQEA